MRGCIFPVWTLSETDSLPVRRWQRPVLSVRSPVLPYIPVLHIHRLFAADFHDLFHCYRQSGQGCISFTHPTDFVFPAAAVDSAVVYGDWWHFICRANCRFPVCCGHCNYDFHRMEVDEKRSPCTCLLISKEKPFRLRFGSWNGFWLSAMEIV